MIDEEFEEMRAEVHINSADVTAKLMMADGGNKQTEWEEF